MRKEHDSGLWGAACDCDSPNVVHQQPCDGCGRIIGQVTDDDYCGPEKLYCPCCLDKARVMVGSTPQKGPMQAVSMTGDAIYTFGESTIEVDFVKIDEAPKDHPFARMPNNELCDHAPMLIYSEKTSIEQMISHVCTCRRCGAGIKWNADHSKYVVAQRSNEDGA